MDEQNSRGSDLTCHPFSRQRKKVQANTPADHGPRESIYMFEDNVKQAFHGALRLQSK